MNTTAAERPSHIEFATCDIHIAGIGVRSAERPDAATSLRHSAGAADYTVKGSRVPVASRGKTATGEHNPGAGDPRDAADGLRDAIDVECCADGCKRKSGVRRQDIRTR